MAEETHEERVNRELIELLNELRVALPGVQVLFAFLLAVPFSQRFAETTELQRDTYMAALLSTLAGSVFLIAPTAYHRIRFRDRDKEALLRISNVFAIVGIGLPGDRDDVRRLPRHRHDLQGGDDDDRHRRDRGAVRDGLVRAAAGAEGELGPASRRGGSW